MQTPQGLNLRSYHSLKSSTINQTSNSLHVNPLSSRLGAVKRTPSQNISKNELYITLGNKVKEAVNWQSGQADLQGRLEWVVAELERHNKRLGVLEGRSNDFLNLRQQIDNKMIQLKSQYFLEIAQMKNSISNSRRELSLAGEKDTFVKMQRESWAKEITEIQSKLDQKMIRQGEKLEIEFDRKLQQVQSTISEYLETLRKETVGQNFYLRPGPFAKLVHPFFKNPNLKLKLLGKVGLVLDNRDSNPEIEGESSECWVEQYSHTYMIDKEGYLLDEQHRYLVNNRGDCVRLNEDQMQMLLGMKIVETMDQISLFHK